MIEEIFINNLPTYGVLGLWVIYLIWKERAFQGEIIRIVRSNTEALNNLHTCLEFLKK